MEQVRELMLVPEPKETLVRQGQLQGLPVSQGTYIFHPRLADDALKAQPSLSCATGGFNILDEMDGYHGEARVCLNQSPLSGKYDLPSLLLRFGMMLPPRDYCAFTTTDGRKLFNNTKVIISKDLNAHM